MKFRIRWLTPLLLLAPSIASADGAALYGANCKSCHGADGTSQTAIGKAMKAPSLVAAPSSADAVIKAVRESPKHKSVAGKVDDDALRGIADYLLTLGGGT